MERYANWLSVVGFALAAWYVYVVGSLFWQGWDKPSLTEYPGLLPLVFILGAIPLPLGAAVLLRRLAAPGPASSPVRWLARLWFVFALCGAVGYLLGLWTVISSISFHAYLDSVVSVISLLFNLASAIFFLAMLPPLWVLSGRPPAPA